MIKQANECAEVCLNSLQNALRNNNPLTNQPALKEQIKPDRFFDLEKQRFILAPERKSWRQTGAVLVLRNRSLISVYLQATKTGGDVQVLAVDVCGQRAGFVCC